jgi:uncharacterized protein YuzE
MFFPGRSHGERINCLKKRDEKMKISYDKEVDAIYIKLKGLKPDGAIEVAEGININVLRTEKSLGSNYWTQQTKSQ